MNVYAVQLDCVWEDKAASFARVRGLLAGAGVETGGLIVLPEMFGTGFSLATDRTVEAEGGATTDFLKSLAAEHGCAVVGGVVEAGTDGRPRNRALAVAPGREILARYTKIHPFSGAGEAAVHVAGTEVVTFLWGGLCFAPFVCYDLRFPEVFRAAAGRGAEVFLVPALWPARRQHHWLTLLQARAIENQAYAVGVNRCGAEPEFSYSGRSVVVDPHGIIIADAGEPERVVRAVLEPDVVRGWRRDFPALRDRHWREAD